MINEFTENLDKTIDKLNSVKDLVPEFLKDIPGVKDVSETKAIQNKIDGCRRENEVEDELKEKYPESEGYSIEKEVYLRDENGKIVKDEETGEARRIDFVVIKDGKVVDMIEVTSKTAPKELQCAKEERIREQGGVYIKDKEGNLIGIPEDVRTKIERRD